MDEQDTQPGKGVKEYIALLKRRKKRLLVVALVGLVASVAVALKLPPVYRSMATILIEEPEVPPDLVQSTVTTYADQRIQVIRQRVMTTENLTEIMDRYSLYTEMRKSDPLTRVIDRFRSDISVDMVSASVRNPRTGRAAKATIAFTLAYESEFPRVAQQVANELVTLFLSENARERQSQAAATTKFLTQEVDRLSARIQELETGLSKFKQKYAGRLPTQLSVNLDIRERTTREILDVNRRLESLKERQAFLNAELTATPKVLEEIVRPQVVRQAPRVQPVADPTVLRLATLRDEFARLGSRYGSGHPTIARLKEEIASLEKEVDGKEAELAAEPEPETNGTKVPEVEKTTRPNPIYAQLRSQLNTVTVELAALLPQKQSLLEKLQDYENRVAQTPEVEREYLNIVRDYDNAQRKYSETKDKQLAAELAQSLEVERKSERFALIEPPQVPSEPIKPKKEIIVGAGFALALAAGLGLVLLVDAFDDRIFGTRHLATMFGEMPLVTVPYIETRGERIRSIAKKIFSIIFLLAVVAAALAIVHLRVMSLELVWFKIASEGRALIATLPI